MNNQPSPERDPLTDLLNSDNVSQEQRDAFLKDIQLENSDSISLVNVPSLFGQKAERYINALLNNSIVKTRDEAIELTKEMQSNIVTNTKFDKDVSKTSIFVSFYVFKLNEKRIIAEQILQEDNTSKFGLYCPDDDSIVYVKEIIDNGISILPITDEEVVKKAIHLPSEIRKYSSDAELDEKIKKFIYKWLDIPQDYTKFAIWNIKKSYLFDKFHTLNYLRALGDLGQGKSRYLDVLGILHYKPLFGSGATTASPLFRIIEKWRGTIILDEADLPKTDEAELIIKIINQGYERGKNILRCDPNDNSKINFFDPFCPKIIASRKEFDDKAVESRCITTVMKGTTRKDIPLNLNDSFYREALEIRNMLTYWRVKKYFFIQPEKEVTFDFGDLEPRLKQIVLGYANLYADDPEGLQELKTFMEAQQLQIRSDRQQSFAGQILGGIHSLISEGITSFDSKDIIEKAQLHDDRTGKLLNPRAISKTLRELGFITKQARNDKKVLKEVQYTSELLTNLFQRYSYDVTVVTIVTERGGSIKTDEKKDKEESLLNFDKHRNNRYNSNTVTEILLLNTTKKDDDYAIFVKKLIEINENIDVSELHKDHFSDWEESHFDNILSLAKSKGDVFEVSPGVIHILL